MPDPRDRLPPDPRDRLPDPRDRMSDPRDRLPDPRDRLPDPRDRHPDPRMDRLGPDPRLQVLQEARNMQVGQVVDQYIDSRHTWEDAAVNWSKVTRVSWSVNPHAGTGIYSPRVLVSSRY